LATEMEHAGDIVDNNLLGIANKMVKPGVTFSKSGQVELARDDRRSLFMTGDERAPRALATEKERFRTLESAATVAHFERPRAGRVDTAETSTMHLDALRDLKSVNSHLVAAAVYPILEGKDELLPTQLRSDEEGLR
jgi:phosphate:Na+ symporter